MIEFQKRLQEIIYNLETGNENLGFRMMVDAVLDTNNIFNFDECIAIANWQEQNENDTETFKQKCKTLVSALEKQEIKIAKQENVLVSAINISNYI